MGEYSLKKSMGSENKCYWCDSKIKKMTPFITVIKRDISNGISVREFCNENCWINWMWELITLNLDTEGDFNYDYL